MNNFVQRVILFFIGIPALLASILLFPNQPLPLWNLLVVIFSGLAGAEAALLFRSDLKKQEVILSGLTIALLTASAFFELIFPAFEFVIPTLIVLLVFLLIPVALAGLKDLPSLIAGIVSRIALLAYPGMFLTFLVKISSLQYPRLKILLFLTLIFSNDTFAYLAGRSFGKRSRHPFAVSPNKTVAGFIGGFIGSAAAGSLFLFLVPDSLPFSLPAALPFFFLIACTANLGDLVESACKRAAGVKDSGRFMLGRGGVLDSTDSVLFSAPFFYYIVLLFCR
ncbi:phosphatidate cytidylyltransferase [Sediminispirochaeta smaragdinae]|uniref:Phosphatidate cytidylyltransferase n=1 Tax=Sediminispirochaeta smaragdinae (strain DSM 11293 / JCM 15392 / SEBR 4228) TaxID=573413 RepID=E1R286_SEDSS|nr:phosphatidate cytidylyltransferase [Sediminispirochaeta smaragdinae]ADK81971.1 phosphatidate cytidylyltransferase [Sediminispirochaeta smaragdinae DSM 11293]